MQDVKTHINRIIINLKTIEAIKKLLMIPIQLSKLYLKIRKCLEKNQSEFTKNLIQALIRVIDSIMDI